MLGNNRQTLYAVFTGITTALVLFTPALSHAGDKATDKATDNHVIAPRLHDRFIVKYVDSHGPSVIPALARVPHEFLPAARAVAHASGKPLGVAHLRRLEHARADVLKASRKLDHVEADIFLRQLELNPRVEYAEIDRVNQLFVNPNDTYFYKQYAMGTELGGMRVTPIWDEIGTQSAGAGVVVAVIDSGITNHSDLNANVVSGYDFITNEAVANDGDGRDSEPWDEDTSNDGCSGNSGEPPKPPIKEPIMPSLAANSTWHGTHVAGIVAAVAWNLKGVAGTAYNAKVRPVRVFGRCTGEGFDSDAVAAIDWASMRSEVINISWGAGGYGECGATMQAAINRAVARGVTVVAAAGNDAMNVGLISPANCDNVITVAATDRNGERAEYSNFGDKVDVAAPGTGIISTYNAGLTDPGSETYATLDGTSMAAPHVAGVVALIQSLVPEPLTPAEMEALLKSTSRPFPVATAGAGTGIVDAYAAWEATWTTPPPDDPPTPPTIDP